MPNVRAMLSEDDLISRYFAPLAGPAGLGLKDDAACLKAVAGTDLVLTADMLVAGVHFFPDDPPASIAQTALGVNLSDLTAKGANPTGFLLSISLPQYWSSEWMEGFADGLGRAATASGCWLLGGDTTKTLGPLTLSITAIGSVPTGKMVPRTGAMPGDLVAVTGTIGDAAIGLKLRATPELDWAMALSEADFTFLLGRYLRPQPPLAFVDALRNHANAAMDVSDGLVGDLAKMLRASGVTGILRIEDVPLSASARAAIRHHPVLLADAVTGGDDYEVLFTLPPKRLADLSVAAQAVGVPFHVIGEVHRGYDPLTVSHNGETFSTSSGSYSHF